MFFLLKSLIEFETFLLGGGFSNPVLRSLSSRHQLGSKHLEANRVAFIITLCKAGSHGVYLCASPSIQRSYCVPVVRHTGKHACVSIYCIGPTLFVMQRTSLSSIEDERSQLITLYGQARLLRQLRPLHQSLPYSRLNLRCRALHQLWLLNLLSWLEPSQDVNFACPGEALIALLTSEASLSMLGQERKHGNAGKKSQTHSVYALSPRFSYSRPGCSIRVIGFIRCGSSAASTLLSVR